MGPLLGRVGAEQPRERFEAGGQARESTPGTARVQQHKRIAVTALVVPHRNTRQFPRSACQGLSFVPLPAAACYHQIRRSGQRELIAALPVPGDGQTGRARLGPPCCAPRSAAPPTPPAAKTLSSPRSTTPRWPNAAPITSRPAASSPGTSPNGPGPSCAAAPCMCDNNGNPVTPAEAKQIIAERWTVPEEIRKRRRSRKIAGKAPQAALTRPDNEAASPAPD